LLFTVACEKAKRFGVFAATVAEGLSKPWKFPAETRFGAAE